MDEPCPCRRGLTRPARSQLPRSSASGGGLARQPPLPLTPTAMSRESLAPRDKIRPNNLILSLSLGTTATPRQRGFHSFIDIVLEDHCQPRQSVIRLYNRPKISYVSCLILPGSRPRVKKERTKVTGVRTATVCSAKPAACRPGVVKKARASMSDGVTGVPIASFKWDAATRKPWNAAVAKLGLGAKPRDFIVELSNTISPLPSPKYVENKLYAARAAARRGPAEEKAFRSRDAAVTLGILARRSRSMRLSRSLSTPIENRIIFM